MKLQKKNQDLEKQLHIAESPEFIEKMAREKLNLAKPGETIILVSQQTKETSEMQDAHTPQTNWKQWWWVFF